MQNNKLENWYKSSFEAIKGKPVPDVWGEIESKIPNKSRNYLFPIVSSIIPIAIVLFVWSGWHSKYQDYTPRNAFFQAASTPLLSGDQAPANNFIAQKPSNRTGYSSIGQAEYKSRSTKENKHVSSRIAVENSKSSEHVVEARSSGLIVNEDSRLQYAQVLSPSLLTADNSVSIAKSNCRETEAKIDRNRYFGANVGVGNVTILNNAFRKGMDPEALTTNEFYIKPSFSLLYGQKIGSSTYLELAAFRTNMGQAISSYDEGEFTTSQQNLNYVGIGAGLVKYKSGKTHFTPYYGANLGGRFLLESNAANQPVAFTKLDLAVGLKGGLSYELNGFLLNAGLASSVSLLNIGGQSQINSQTSRNLSAGFEVSVCKLF